MDEGNSVGVPRQFDRDCEQWAQERSSDAETARQLLETIIENMPDTMFLKEVGDGFRYRMINAAGERLFGLDRSEIIGRTDDELVPAQEAEQCRREDERAARTLEPLVVAERELTTANGKRLIESRKLPLQIAGEQKMFVLGVIRDLTETRALESQVREMLRLDSIGRLTGGIAHDFNNLLAVIMGSIELVRDQLPDESEPAEIADEAIAACRRGAELVRRLLAFARRQHLEPVPVDLNERLPLIVPLLQRTLGEDIRVRVRTSDELWAARIDPSQVDDALVNLAINARDAMPAGGTLTIETCNHVIDRDYADQHVEVEPGAYVVLCVSDTGTGMSPEVAARAFEPFFTTKPEGQGTGLGLSQLFGWVKQSGGHVNIYSELGHGTTIKLYLPCASSEDDGQEERQSGEPPGSGPHRILLVEDNPDVRRIAARQLSDLGHAVTETGDPRAALELIGSGAQFDLLLTDIVMPGGMNGYELANAAERIAPGLKLLFASGYTELAASEFDQPLAAPLISKPYSRRDLSRAICAAFDRQERMG